MLEWAERPESRPTQQVGPTLLHLPLPRADVAGGRLPSGRPHRVAATAVTRTVGRRREVDTRTRLVLLSHFYSLSLSLGSSTSTTVTTPPRCHSRQASKLAGSQSARPSLAPRAPLASPPSRKAPTHAQPRR